MRTTTIEQRAQREAVRLYGRKAVARRTTGDRGKSGYFRAYKHDRKLGCLNSVGAAFHVS